MPEASQPATAGRGPAASASTSRGGGAAAAGRHASGTGGEHGKVDDYIATSIAGATMLGQLRRFMLRYRAMLLPRHVVDVLAAMERIYSGRATAGAAPAQRPTPRTSGLRGATRVHSAAPAAAPAGGVDGQAAERQTVLYMMGDLGNMLWGHLDEIEAPGLAACIWCWARLSWHPDPQLLSEVARRFCAPATLAALGPADLVRGVWGLGELGALGEHEMAAVAPRVRELLPQLDKHQLQAVTRAFGTSAADDGSGGVAHGGGSSCSGGGAVGGRPSDVAALAQELLERAQQLHGSGGGSGRAAP